MKKEGSLISVCNNRMTVKQLNMFNVPFDIFTW